MEHMMMTYASCTKLLLLLAMAAPASCAAHNVDIPAAGARATAGRSSRESEIRGQLDELKSRFVQAAIDENVDERLKHYAPDVISMPEYQPMLQGLRAVRTYYEEVFRRQDVKRYEKKIDEVIDLDAAVVEIGTFEIEYDQPPRAEITRHQGKYWNVWSLQTDASLKLEAEVWGYVHPVADPASLYVKIADEPPVGAPASSEADRGLWFELRALNTLMQEAVRNRDARLRADFFTDDAIFMPHADSSKRGIDEIGKYLVDYNSGPVTIESISIATHALRAFDGYVIEYPNFHVAWRTPQQSGISSGQGLRIWKRLPDCTLRLYREIGTHDHLE